MKLFTTFSFLLLMLYFISCDTQPPDILQPVQKEGSVIITSDISGAKVYLNSVYKGVADLTLSLQPGEYSIYLVKDTLRSDTQTVNVESGKTYRLYFVLGQRSSVLLEDFANVSCDPCVESSLILDKLLSARYANDKLIVIRYATNFPSPNDPFYLANSGMNDNRIGMYNVLFAPTTIVDGVEKPIATDSVSIIEAVDSRLSLHSSFLINNLSLNITSDSISVSGNLILPSSGYENDKLFIALIRKEVVYQTPPGSNGETVFRDVAFAFIPNNDGVPLTDLTVNNNSAAFEYKIVNTFTEPADNIAAVFFIQNIISREVYFVTKKE